MVDAFRKPAYGALVTGIRSAVDTGVPVRDIVPAFAVPPGMDPLFIYSLAGGALDDRAPDVLVVEQDGTTSYRRVP
jgi:hypothetical protein